MVDQFRKKRELSLDAFREDGFDAGFEPLAGVALKMDAESVRQVIESLEPKYRDAVILHHVNGLSIKEIVMVQYRE